MKPRREVTDELRGTVRKELPEVEDIEDADLRQKVVEAWALCLAHSSFDSIDAIEPAANPGVNRLKDGKQSDHIRGVTRLAVVVAEQMCALMPALKVDKDILIAGALCHDVASPSSSTRKTVNAGRPAPMPQGCRPSATQPSGFTSA